jgi:Zn-dependent protease/CBS domain-containing protein
MSWSWRIGRLSGIDVYVHFTFVLLLAWFGVTYYSEHRDIGEAARGVAFILCLFGIVVLHELGHALAARRYGIATRDITLLPIGGVARLDRIPEQPSQELVVAIAGPAVNIVLAAALYFGWSVESRLGMFQFSEMARAGSNLIAQLFVVNLMLAAFNLLPAFPMDGGRVLRALLAMRMDYVRATQLAATIGQGMAILLAVAGLFGNPFLILIALFIWYGAGQEAALVQMRSALTGIPVQRAMATHFQTLTPEEPIAAVARHVLAGFQQDFPVVDNEGRVVGVLLRRDLTASLAASNSQTPVSEVMQRDFVVVHPRDMLSRAFTKLQECQCSTLPVVDERDRLVGLLTSDNLAEVIMLRTGANSSQPGSAEPGDAVAAARQRLQMPSDRA